MYNPDNLPPDTLTINVEQRHIEQGAKCDCTDCAVGLALQEQYPLGKRYWWSITQEYGVELKFCATYKQWAMTPELKRFIIAFDTDRPVEPATFVLEAAND